MSDKVRFISVNWDLGNSLGRLMFVFDNAKIFLSRLKNVCFNNFSVNCKLTMTAMTSASCTLTLTRPRTKFSPPDLTKVENLKQTRSLK